MDKNASRSKLENEGSIETEKKSLSRSSTGDGDEWVLVNSLGSEIEDASCQAQSIDVGTTVNFNAPMADDAAVSMSIDLKPLALANVYCLAVQEPEIKELDEEKEKENNNLEPDVPTVEVSATACLSAPTAVADVTDDGITDTFSQVEGKTIKGGESSETSSQISILDHEDLSKSVEGKPSPLESSVSTDSGGYEVVNALLSRADQTSEPERNEIASLTSDDELPIAFVQSCSDRVRNYFHSYNLALNWKLSLLVVVASAAVLGLGLGHFIGSTHVWLTRQNQVQQRQEEQLQMLQTRLIDCLSKLQREEAGLEDEPAKPSECENGFCQVHEKPSCPATGDFEARLEGCSKLLETCQNNLNAVEEENKKRSKNMVKAFKDLHLLRQNLKQVHATYEKLSALLIAEREHLHGDDDDAGGDRSSSSKKMEEMTKKLKESELREEKLINQEVELRRMLSHLESTVAALNTELTKMKSKSAGRKDQEKCNAKQKSNGGDEDAAFEGDEETPNFDFNWNRFSDLLQQLKETTKVDQIVESYLDLFKDLKLPEINISKIWLDQLPASLEEIAKNLKQGLDEKVNEFENTLYETNWDDYVQKAKDVTSRVGETVGTLWKKAKDLSDHVREQHGEQGEKIFNDIKTTVEKAAEVFDQRWDQATRFWRDVVGSSDAEEQEDEQEMPDDGKDQVWVYHESASEDEPIDAGEAIEENSGWNRGDINEEKREQAYLKENGWTYLKPDFEKIPEPTNEMKYNPSDSAREVKELREALKSSSVFSYYVTDEFADHYFRRLKQAGKALSQNGDDHSTWWMCQKLWWTHHSFAYGRQCSDKLMSWQRHVRVDLDVRQNLIDQTPELKRLVKKLVNDEETQKIQDGANWVFEWAKNRQEMRREDEQRKKKDEKNGWIYERWRSRDEMRHQEEISPSKWLFRRGKEREKKRGDEQGDYWQHRRRTNVGAKESSKKPPYAPRHRR